MSNNETNIQVVRRQSPLSQAINKVIMCTALALPFSLSVPSYATAQDSVKNIQVEAGELGTAISNFAADNGVVIYFNSSITQGMRTEGLSGKYSISEGLSQLLSGSNLKAVKEADGSYRLVDLTQGAASTKQLGTMLVESEKGRREPGNIFIDSKQLARTQASSLENIFSGESSVAVGSGAASGHKIYVRGFEDVMLNVTVDGRLKRLQSYIITKHVFN